MRTTPCLCALLSLGLLRCGADTPTSTQPDAAPAGQVDALHRSRQAWDALMAAMGDTYSYSEENCVVNAPTHKVSVVQVRDGDAMLFSTAMIPTSECMATVNRYDDFSARPLQDLYKECERLLAAHGGAVSVSFDDRNLIKGCTWSGAESCSDNCGEGFYLRSLSFGQLEVP
jgi:hypothetical protein